MDFAGSMSFSDFAKKHILCHSGKTADKDTAQVFDFSIWQHCTDALECDTILLVAVSVLLLGCKESGDTKCKLSV